MVTTTSISNPSTMEPTLKLELFSPDQKQSKMGMYNPYGQYIPEGMGIHTPLDLYGITKEDKLKAKQFSASSYQNMFAPTYAVSQGMPVKMPVQQVYNINLPGPTGDHVMMDKIYEDILPGRENKMTSTTLGERLITYDYLRQLLIKIHEGEDMSLESSGTNNLMSYIKIMELNPNFYSPLSQNPYRGLPFGLLIYRSCFPIRYDTLSKGILCSKTSIGLNIRLYALTCAEYHSFKSNNISLYLEYDVWRELEYYILLREKILKKKKSPNFPLMYAYFMSPNQAIDYFKLKKRCLTQKDEFTMTNKYVNRDNDHFNFVIDTNQILRPMITYTGKKVKKLPDEIDPVLQTYSGYVLILITESSHHNLYQWASRIYEKNGIVEKMVSTGYYLEEVWLNVIFQIISALYVMQLYGLYMRNMTIEDNVYIKDLQTYGKSMNYWKYIINGISYYVPNEGYLVLIDSNFKDIFPSGVSVERCKREYKIYSTKYIGKKYEKDSVQKKVFQNYRNIINTNAFSKEHTQNFVMKPPESVMKMIEKMMEDPETDLGKVISKYFYSFMNNRIGTLLRKDTEVPYIREITNVLKKGEMVIEVIEDQLFRWAMVNKDHKNGIIEIITRNDPKTCDFSTKDIRIENLKRFSPTEKIEQNMTNEYSFSEDELLETYIINYDDDDTFNNC